MNVLRTLVAIALAVCMADDAPLSAMNPHIVGGEDAERGEFPWHVKVLYRHKGSTYFCGGAILDKNNILTAGHCATDKQQRSGFYEVVAGLHNSEGKESFQQSRSVKSVALHKKYRRTKMTLKNDVAILHLDTPLEFTYNIQAVNLSDAAFDDIAMESKRCLVTGHGLVKQRPVSKLPDVLQKVNVNVIPDSECEAKSIEYQVRVNTKMHLCSFTPGQASCNGDSGGSVGCYDDNNIFRQVGIVSFGPNKPCREGYSVDARVSNYRKWIIANSI